MSIGTTKLEQIVKEMDKVAVFIDGHATQGAAKSIDLKIDWNKFQNIFMDLARVKKISYYLAVPEDIEGFEEDEFGSKDIKIKNQNYNPWWRGVVDWMSYNSYRVVLRKGREFDYKDSNEGVGIKTPIDMILALDALSVSDSVDHIILFTGNTDYTYLVNMLQAKNVVVTVISNSYNKLKSINKISENADSYPFIASRALIKSANHFIDLHDLVDSLDAST